MLALSTEFNRIVLNTIQKNNKKRDKNRETVRERGRIIVQRDKIRKVKIEI
jgi:hypothetical protein